MSNRVSAKIDKKSTEQRPRIIKPRLSQKERPPCPDGLPGKDIPGPAGGELDKIRLTPRSVIQLQQSHGNAFVRQLLGHSPATQRAADGGSQTAGATPPREIALYNQAQTSFRQGNYQEAFDAYKRFVALPGTELVKGKAYLQMSRCQLALGNVYVAERYAKKAMAFPQAKANEALILFSEIKQKQSKVEFSDAVAKYRAGQLQEAMIAFEHLRQDLMLDEGTRTKSLFNIGICNKRLRRYVTALRYFEAYLGLPEANIVKGTRLVNLMKTKAGIPANKRKGKITPEAASRQLAQANNYASQRQYGRAIIAYERLIHHPGVPESVSTPALLNAGICNYRMRRYTAASLYFQQYLKLPAARNDKGTRLLAKTRKYLGLTATNTVKEK